MAQDLHGPQLYEVRSDGIAQKCNKDNRYFVDEATMNRREL